MQLTPCPGRELCALARVVVNGDPGIELALRRRLPVWWLLAHPPAVPGPHKTPAADCVDRRRSADRLGVRSNRPFGRVVPRPVRGAERHAAVAQRPAWHRRSFWLEPTSVRRALAVPMQISSDASATAATPSQSFTEPSVRSRRLPGAAG